MFRTWRFPPPLLGVLKKVSLGLLRSSVGFLRSCFGTFCVGVFAPLALQHPQVEQDTILRLELPGEEFREQAKA